MKRTPPRPCCSGTTTRTPVMTRSGRPTLTSATRSKRSISPSSRAPSAFGLSRLIAPVDVDEFARRHWEREPLIVQRKAPSYYDELMTLGDVDAVLATSNVRSPNVQVVRAGRDLSGDDGRLRAPNVAEGGLEDLYQQYRDGATIVLVYLHERWPPLQALCRSLASQTSAAIQVNAYLTPPNAQGLDVHYDRHDVFVLQIAGSKCWRVFGAPTRLPLPDWPPRPSDAGEPLHDLTLHAGESSICRAGSCTARPQRLSRGRRTSPSA